MGSLTKNTKKQKQIAAMKQDKLKAKKKKTDTFSKVLKNSLKEVDEHLAINLDKHPFEASYGTLLSSPVAHIKVFLNSHDMILLKAQGAIDNADIRQLLNLEPKEITIPESSKEKETQALPEDGKVNNSVDEVEDAVRHNADRDSNADAEHATTEDNNSEADEAGQEEINDSSSN